ncbi:hypothetical protein GCM10009127_04020 [Alteraurantiacibacter aestuarii]
MRLASGQTRIAFSMVALIATEAREARTMVARLRIVKLLIGEREGGFAFGGPNGARN